MEDEIEKKPFYDEEILGEGFGRLDLAMEKELHGKQSVWALIVMIAGAVLYGLYLVFAVFLDAQFEYSLSVAQRTSGIGAVGIEQLHRGLLDGLLALGVIELARDEPLLGHRHRRR